MKLFAQQCKHYRHQHNLTFNASLKYVLYSSFAPQCRMLILLHANIHILLNHMDAYPWKQTMRKPLRQKCNFNFSFSHGSQHQENVHLSNTKLLKASARSRIVQQNLGVCWPTSRTRGCQWQSLLFHLCLALLLLRRGAWKPEAGWWFQSTQIEEKHELNHRQSLAQRGVW